MNRRPHEPPMAEPIAYFLTWPTYGTWLPGDERGWVEHRHGWQFPDSIRKLEAGARMTEAACVLDSEQRQLVEQTITEHCRIRGWHLHAVSCRTNHLHIVVSADLALEEIRKQFKAWCTRRLKELEMKRHRAKGKRMLVRENWWAERGSQRYINDDESLEAAIHYVRDYQD